MSIERGPGSLPKPPAGENNLVPLTSVLEIINRSPLLSVQKTALVEALKKGFQIEKQWITPAKDNESGLLVKLEEVFKIDTDPDSSDNEEDRAGVVVKTAEVYKELATNLVKLLKEDGPDDLNLTDLDDNLQEPQELTENILESVKEAWEALQEKSKENPDLELIVITVLESLGINFDNLLPQEKSMIFYDLERRGIEGPEPKEQ